MNQPARLGRYRLVRRVGAGGFATVWLAHDEELDAEVAIKILSDNWIDEADVRRRFIAEGRFLRRVDSPHVIGVHDVGEAADGRPYLVLTYADGGSLAGRIKAGPLDVGTVVEVITQVGTGLQQLHDRGVLHRDVKPANVLFRSDPDGERAMLGDLGLGKSLEHVSQLTMPGGTPAYAAPEQVKGEPLDGRADVYSLGAVAYAALTGQVPHGVNSLGAVLAIDGPPPLMATLRAGVPDAVDAVVRRALEPDRERRWPDVTAFLTALQQAFETGKLPGATDPGGSAGAGPSRRAWLAAATAAAVLGAAGGFAGYRFIADRPVEVRSPDGVLSVRVPRGWTTDQAFGWTPVAGRGEQPALLVSPLIDSLPLPASGVPGVFVGVVPSGGMPTSLAPPPGCRLPQPVERSASSVTQEFRACGGDAVVTERVVRIDEQRWVRIQVRAGDGKLARQVLDSARYPGR